MIEHPLHFTKGSFDDKPVRKFKEILYVTSNGKQVEANYYKAKSEVSSKNGKSVCHSIRHLLRTNKGLSVNAKIGRMWAAHNKIIYMWHRTCIWKINVIKDQVLFWHM